MFTWFFTLFFYCNSCCLFTSIFTSKFTYNPKVINRKTGCIYAEKTATQQCTPVLKCHMYLNDACFSFFLYPVSLVNAILNLTRMRLLQDKSLQCSGVKPFSKVQLSFFGIVFSKRNVQGILALLQISLLQHSTGIWIMHLFTYFFHLCNFLGKNSQKICQ